MSTVDRHDLRVREVHTHLEAGRTAPMTGVSVCVYSSWRDCVNQFSNMTQKNPKISWFRPTRQHERPLQILDRRDPRIRGINMHLEVGRTDSTTEGKDLVHILGDVWNCEFLHQMSKFPWFRLQRQCVRAQYRLDRRDLHIRGVNIHLEAGRTASITEAKDLVYIIGDPHSVVKTRLRHMFNSQGVNTCHNICY